MIELFRHHPDPRELRHRRAPSTLWRRWMVAVTLGEALGFAVPALVGVLVRDASLGTVVVALLVAGMAEGAVLGAAQAHVLVPMVPGLRARSWTVATVLGGTAAWAIALIVMAVGESATRWPVVISVPLAVVGAVTLLVSVGVAQWLVLKRFVARAHRWIVGTALAWLGGLAAFFALTTPLWQPGQPFELVVVIGIAGGLLMAAVMAAVTGWFLVGLLAGSPGAKEQTLDAGAHGGSVGGRDPGTPRRCACDSEAWAGVCRETSRRK